MNNACATLAVLNGICNIPELEMGEELRDLIAFTTGMDASVRLLFFFTHFLRFERRCLKLVVNLVHELLRLYVHGFHGFAAEG